MPALTAGGVPSLGPAATAAPARAVPALPQDVDGDGYAEAVVGGTGWQPGPGLGGTDGKGDAFGEGGRRRHRVAARPGPRRHRR
ncbi:hypothetical protein ACWFRL_01435, partial [Streptomyces diastaticus]